MEGEGAPQPLLEMRMGQVVEVPRLEVEGAPSMAAARLYVRKAEHGMEVVVVVGIVVKLYVSVEVVVLKRKS